MVLMRRDLASGCLVADARKRPRTDAERAIVDSDMRVGTSLSWEGVYEEGTFGDQLRVGFSMLRANEA